MKLTHALTLSLALWTVGATAAEPSARSADPVSPGRVSAAIRQSLSARDELAGAVRNIDIVEGPEGTVTLTGFVSTMQEKLKIAFLATKAAGPDKVQDRLEVKKEK